MKDEDVCEKYPECGSGRMVMDLMNTQGQLLASNEKLVKKMGEVTQNQLDQQELWKKYLEEVRLVTSLTGSLNSLTAVFTEFKEDSKKSHDFFGNELRALQAKKVSRGELKTYAAIIVVVMGGMFSFFKYIL